MSKRNPSDFLRQVLRRAVVVRLNNGTDFRGILACLDDRLNIAMEQAEEYQGDRFVQKYGDLFIRGNNVLYIRAAVTKRQATVVARDGEFEAVAKRQAVGE